VCCSYRASAAIEHYKRATGKNRTDCSKSLAAADAMEKRRKKEAATERTKNETTF
jgi:hypothetical protein